MGSSIINLEAIDKGVNNSERKVCSELKHEEQVQKKFLLNITPSYKLRAEEDVVHDLLGQSYVHHGDAGPLEVIHQILVVIGVLLQEARLHQAEIVPRAYLGNCQSDGSTVADDMEGNLPSTHRDVLETILQSVAPCIQGTEGVTRRQLDGF